MDADELKAKWQASLNRVGDAGRAYRKKLVMRCHAAMGPERALQLADMVQVGAGLTPSQALKGAIKRYRASEKKYPWTYNPERVRECFAAWLWVRQIARRDREFFSKRSAA